MDLSDPPAEPSGRSPLGIALLVLLAVAGGWAAMKHFGIGIGGGTPSPTRYDWDFAALWKYRTLLGTGLLYTLGFTVICVVAGLVIGVATGLGRLSRSRLSGLSTARVMYRRSCRNVRH